MLVELPTLIAVLKDTRSCKISFDEAKLSVAKLDWQVLDCIGEVYSALDHFWSDADIRARNQQYAEFQEAELSKLINHLEKQDFNSAIAITFLHVS